MNVVRPLVTARASDSMFYVLTLCALNIVFMIMIMINNRLRCRTESVGQWNKTLLLYTTFQISDLVSRPLSRMTFSDFDQTFRSRR